MKKISSVANIILWMLLMINLFATVGIVCVNYSKIGLDMSQHLLMVSTSADNGGMVYHTLTVPDKVLSEKYVYTVGKSSDVHVGSLNTKKVMEDESSGYSYKPSEYKIKGVYLYTDRYINTLLWLTLIVGVINWVYKRRARKNLTKTKRFSNEA